MPSIPYGLSAQDSERKRESMSEEIQAWLRRCDAGVSGVGKRCGCGARKLAGIRAG